MELESESDNRNCQESESKSDDGTSDSTALQDTTPELLNHHIKQAGFAHIDTTYFKCFSCHGTRKKWETDDDPWKIHAQHFPYCPHVTYWNTKFYVKDIKKKEHISQQQYIFYC